MDLNDLVCNGRGRMKALVMKLWARLFGRLEVDFKQAA